MYDEQSIVTENYGCRNPAGIICEDGYYALLAAIMFDMSLENALYLVTGRRMDDTVKHRNVTTRPSVMLEEKYQQAKVYIQRNPTIKPTVLCRKLNCNFVTAKRFILRYRWEIQRERIDSRTYGNIKKERKKYGNL